VALTAAIVGELDSETVIQTAQRKQHNISQSCSVC